MDKIRVFTAFSGYDSQCLALDRLKRDNPQFDYELVGWSEIDKYAIQAHNALYPQWTDRNFGDISKIDWSAVPDFDLFTYSFPCTQISRAGRQEGLSKGSGTASSLVWECLRAIKLKSPKYLLMENVADLLGDKMRNDFESWSNELVALGYVNYAQLLKAPDYGIPQSRKRVFMVSILGGGGYEFPTKRKCEKRLRDVIDYNVAEKYYKDDKHLWKIQDHVSRPQTICLNSKENGKQPSLQNRVYDVNGIAPACTCSFHPYIAEPRIMQIGNIAPDTPTFKNRTHGRVYDINGISPTLNCSGGGSREPIIYVNARLRKLTPKEFFRLQDVAEDDIGTIMRVGLSDSAMYKLAGNSIPVGMLYYVFEQLFCDCPVRMKQQTLF